MNDPAQLSPQLTVLERTVLEVALAPDVDTNDRFRSQMEAAIVSTRTPSGVGFMTKLEVPETLAIPDSLAGGALPVVFGVHPDLPSGAEFILQVKDGRLNTIEGFCYEGMWPGDDSLFRVEIRP